PAPTITCRAMTSSSIQRALLSLQSKRLSVHCSVSRAPLSILWHTGLAGCLQGVLSGATVIERTPCMQQEQQRVSVRARVRAEMTEEIKTTARRQLAEQG